MSEYTKLFERTRARFDGADLRLEKMYRRRARKRRNEKIGAIVLALIIALASTAAIVNTIAGLREPKPESPTITPGTASQLQLRWTGETGGLSPTPVVTDGVVVTETRSGHVVAFPDHCGTNGGACAPLWTAEMDPMAAPTDGDDPAITWWSATHGSPGEPMNDGALTAAGGIVYGGSKAGTIYAFDVHCRTDGQACGPEWTARLPDRSGARHDRGSSGPPVVANGLVLVQGRDGTFAFRVGCGTGGDSCSPVWQIRPGAIRVQGDVLYTTSTSGFGPERGRAYAYNAVTGAMIWRSDTVRGSDPIDPTPVRYGDTVYVNSGRELLAFPADCRARCVPTWTAPITDTFSSQPVVVGDVVAMTVFSGGSTGGVAAYPVDCTTDGRSCRRRHEVLGFPELTFVGPQASGDRLYAEAFRAGGVYVFDGSCLAKRADCPVVWQNLRAVTPWETVVRDGVAYEADLSSAVRAFDAGCSADPCPTLWQSAEAPDGTPLVAGGEVLFSSHDGVIHVYAPGEPLHPQSKAGAGWFYGALALGGLVIVGGRTLRRRRLV